MFEKLKRLIQGEPPPTRSQVNDPELGTLTWSEDDEAWITRSDHLDLGFILQISGTPDPDSILLSHAKGIIQNRDDFISGVSSFLHTEMASVKYLAEFKNEIEELRIERVCLFWPDRPNNGMIFFAGGSDHRRWRCDHVDRIPKGLGFDS